MEELLLLLRIWFVFWVVFKVFEMLHVNFVRFQNVLKEGLK